MTVASFQFFHMYRDDLRKNKWANWEWIEAENEVEGEMLKEDFCDGKVKSYLIEIWKRKYDLY